MSDRAGFDSPEEAARGDIPERYARTVATAVSPSGADAVVVLATNEPPHIYPYVVVSHHRGGRWIEGAGGNNAPGGGWSSTEGADDPQLGVWHLSGEPSEGVSAVVVAFGDQEQRVPVNEHGWFLFAAWDVPSGPDWPVPIRLILEDGTEQSPAW